MLTIWTQTPPITFPMSLVTRMTQKPVLRIKNIPKIDVFSVFFTKSRSASGFISQKNKNFKMLYLKNQKELEAHIPDPRVSSNFQSTEPKIFFRISANENRVRYIDDPHGARGSDLAPMKYTTSKMSPQRRHPESMKS